MADTQLVGGWSELAPLTEHDKYVFEKAFSGLAGINSQPHFVSRQVVNGMNYAFFCGASSATNPPLTGFVIAEAHEATDGTVSRTNITTYGMIPQALHHWSDAMPLNDHDTAVFEKAVKGFKEVTHTPHLVSHQIAGEGASGKNYRFFCTSKSLTRPQAAATGFSIITIHENAPIPENEGAGDVRITNITTFG